LSFSVTERKTDLSSVLVHNKYLGGKLLTPSISNCNNDASLGKQTSVIGYVRNQDVRCNVKVVCHHHHGVDYPDRQVLPANRNTIITYRAKQEKECE